MEVQAVENFIWEPKDLIWEPKDLRGYRLPKLCLDADMAPR